MTISPQNQLFNSNNASETTTKPAQSPERIARRVADWVKNLLVILFWLVVLIAGLALSAVIISAVLVACAHARRALGI